MSDAGDYYEAKERQAAVIRREIEWCKANEAPARLIRWLESELELAEYVGD